MAVSKELLDILVCPLCNIPVNLSGDQKVFKCSTCRRVYPGRDNMSLMLVDESRIDSE
jgi:uncharacterized protein YbaR (Trm112 family)